MNILEPADYAPIPVPIQVPRSASPVMPMFRSNRAAWVRAPLEPIAEESLGSWASQEGDPQGHEYIPMDQFQGHFRDVNSPAMADPEQVSVLLSFLSIHSSKLQILKSLHTTFPGRSTLTHTCLQHPFAQYPNIYAQKRNKRLLKIMYIIVNLPQRYSMLKLPKC